MAKKGLFRVVVGVFVATRDESPSVGLNPPPVWGPILFRWREGGDSGEWVRSSLILFKESISRDIGAVKRPPPIIGHSFGKAPPPPRWERYFEREGGRYDRASNCFGYQVPILSSDTAFALPTSQLISTVKGEMGPSEREVSALGARSFAFPSVRPPARPES